MTFQERIAALQSDIRKLAQDERTYYEAKAELIKTFMTTSHYNLAIGPRAIKNLGNHTDQGVTVHFYDLQYTTYSWRVFFKLVHCVEQAESQVLSCCKRAFDANTEELLTTRRTELHQQATEVIYHRMSSGRFSTFSPVRDGDKVKFIATNLTRHLDMSDCVFGAIMNADVTWKES